MTQRGFTLLEVLIAMALFSLLGLASYQLLERVLHSERRIQQHERELRQLQRALDVLQRDLWQAMPHPLADDPSRRQALIGHGHELRLRAAAGPTRCRSAAARCCRPPTAGTRVAGCATTRTWTAAPCAASACWTASPDPPALIDASGQARDAWPAADGALALPRALEIELDAPVSRTSAGSSAARQPGATA